MKHLNSDEHSEHFGGSTQDFDTPVDYELSLHRSDSDVRLGLSKLRAHEAELCVECKRRNSTQRKIDNHAGTLDESFEDLGNDCLINQIRFIAIDCRLNQLREECALPHALSFDLTSSTQV
jgi:hypothetical protein